MANDTKIEIQDKTDHTPDEMTKWAAERIAEATLMSAPSPQTAVEALLLAATELMLHSPGNLQANTEALKAKLDGLVKWGMEEHADCIERLKAKGHQHDHATTH